MKKLIILCLLFLGSFAVVSAQSPFQGFFKPVPKNLFESPEFLKSDQTPKDAIWLIRFDVQITAVQLQYIKDEKKWVSSPFSSAGPGIGYKRYVEVDGEPYNNFGANLILLLGYDWTEISTANLSLVGTVNFFEFINFGGGYNFGHKAPVLLMGASVKF